MENDIELGGIYYIRIGNRVTSVTVSKITDNEVTIKNNSGFEAIINPRYLVKDKRTVCNEVLINYTCEIYNIQVQISKLNKLLEEVTKEMNQFKKEHNL